MIPLSGQGLGLGWRGSLGAEADAGLGAAGLSCVRIVVNVFFFFGAGCFRDKAKAGNDASEAAAAS